MLSRRLPILSAPFLLLLLIEDGSLQYLPKNCTEVYSAKVSKISTTYTSRKSTTSCFTGWSIRRPFRCTKYRQVKTTKEVYITEEKERDICCNGSVPFNKTSCTTECPEGMYGRDCTKNCSCPTVGKWSSCCEKMTGNCNCENGYRGSNCTEVCSPGYFGENCEETCLCHATSTCDHVDGSCNCTHPGRTGEYCQNICTNITFGYDCKEECTCTANETCYPINGKCTCKAGLTGEDCQTVCTNFTFGPDCKNVCNCERENSHECHPVTGECTCRPGWEGRTCSEVCGMFIYGLKCSQNCTCDNSQFCNHVDGTCYSDLCYGPNTINCGHQETMNFCEQIDYENNFNTTNNEGRSSIYLKIQDICRTLDAPRSSLICLTESPCNCSTGFEGQFCSKEPFDPSQVSDTNTGKTLTIVAVILALVCAGIVIIMGIFLHRRMQSKKSRAKSIANRAYALNDFQQGDDSIPASTTPRPSDYSRNSGIEGRVNEDEYDDLNRRGQHRQRQGRALNTTENAYSHLNSPHERNDGTYSHMSTSHDQPDGTYSHMNSAHDPTDGTYSHTNSPYDQSEGNYSHMNTGDAQAEGSYDYTQRESNADGNSSGNVYSVAQLERSSSLYANSSTGKQRNREKFKSTNAEEEL